MIYTKLTFLAMNIAYSAHHGQYDKNGAPYIFHPIHLAEQMEDEFSCCAALLHDVMEDTDFPPEKLAEQFPKEVMEALILLMHRPCVPYMDYVKAIGKNEIARRVKLADLDHNGDLKRVNPDHPIPEETRARLEKRYREAKEYLISVNGSNNQ